MLTTEQYFKDSVVDDDIRSNAVRLLTKVNHFLADFKYHYPEWTERMNSGYRDPAHNATIGGAGKSKHMTGEAVDVGDYDRSLALFCLANEAMLASQGLFCEDMRATRTWVHFQTVAPGSGKRFFIPNTAWAIKLKDQPLTPESLKCVIAL